MINPSTSSLLDWAASLNIDFPQDTIPVIMQGDSWMEWATQVCASKTFAINNTPRPDGFADWREWASRVYGIMN